MESEASDGSQQVRAVPRPHEGPSPWHHQFRLMRYGTYMDQIRFKSRDVTRNLYHFQAKKSGEATTLWGGRLKTLCVSSRNNDVLYHTATRNRYSWHEILQSCTIHRNLVQSCNLPISFRMKSWIPSKKEGKRRKTHKNGGFYAFNFKQNEIANPVLKGKGGLWWSVPKWPWNHRINVHWTTWRILKRTNGACPKIGTHGVTELV